ncbi:MAG: hypothetical protein ACXWR1_04260 [Bdellovibrionota bacterium]
MPITLFWSLLAISTPAFAGVWDGRAVLENCQQTNIKIPVACRNEIPPDVLATILPVADKMVGDEQVRKIKEYDHEQLSAELKRSIKARKTLLACMDKPDDKKCATRIAALRTQLEKNVARLRIALALSRTPLVIDDRSVGTQIQLPGPLGATPLPPLSNAEAESARAFQKSALAASERVGLEKLRQDSGIEAGSDELVSKCRRQEPDLLEICQKIRAIHEESFVQFRASMGKIAGNIISDLPFALSFSSVPISDAELKKQLAKSLKTLSDWNDDNGDTDEDDDKKWSTLLSDSQAYTEQYVAEHPEACPAAERNIRLTGRMQFAKDLGVSVRDVTAVTLVCSVSTPLICISASGVVLGKDTKNAYSEWSQIRRRIASADEENPQASLDGAGDAYRDLLVAVALDSLDTADYAKWALKGGEDFVSLRKFVKKVEKKPSRFYHQAGEMFSTLAENVEYDLPIAGGSAVGEAVTSAMVHMEPSGVYSEWLKSDAYTARVYEAFEQRDKAK